MKCEEEGCEEESQCLGCHKCQKHHDEEVHGVDQDNPAYICMGGNCNKYLGYRGFCSDKCHNSHYDNQDKEVSKNG